MVKKKSNSWSTGVNNVGKIDVLKIQNTTSIKIIASHHFFTQRQPFTTIINKKGFDWIQPLRRKQQPADATLQKKIINIKDVLCFHENNTIRSLTKRWWCAKFNTSFFKHPQHSPLYVVCVCVCVVQLYEECCASVNSSRCYYFQLFSTIDYRVSEGGMKRKPQNWPQKHFMVYRLQTTLLRHTLQLKTITSKRAF